MTPKRFRSKIDRWVLFVLAGVLVFQAAALGMVAYGSGGGRELVIIIFATLMVFALIGWLLVSTHYSVDSRILKVVSGPFRWKIPLEEITSIEQTRNPLSSPALSLDRLRITWGPRNRRIMVSPADQRGFVRALGMELTR